MATESRIRPRQFWFLVGYAALCAVLGVWGAYDYWERIPRQEAACAEYAAASDKVKEFAPLTAPGSAPLSDAQAQEYEAARKILDRYAGGAPTPVAAYDRPLQLWAYMVGCGIIGTGWCIVSLARTASRHYRLDDDGTLHAAGRTIARDDVEGISMSRWMAKSIATLQVRGGPPVQLDDYKYQGLHLIVGHYAHRFDPSRWNADGTAVRKAGAASGSPAGSGGPDSDSGGKASSGTADASGGQRSPNA